ncbi:hypothetical protein PARMER_04106 [Parabacteroides merdae ATCC 43184]|nr:hypothetical protein PARMER_04106 [Parabacteroides merdae ATCC 43184]
MRKRGFSGWLLTKYFIVLYNHLVEIKLRLEYEEFNHYSQSAP